MIEVNHRVSHEASDLLWRLANEAFHDLYVAKGDSGRKIPQFPHLRNKLYEVTPKVRMEIGYQHKEDGNISIVKDVTKIPVSRHPPCTYKRLYEIASVDVSYNIKYKISLKKFNFMLYTFIIIIIFIFC